MHTAGSQEKNRFQANWSVILHIRQLKYLETVKENIQRQLTKWLQNPNVVTYRYLLIYARYKRLELFFSKDKAVFPISRILRIVKSSLLACIIKIKNQDQAKPPHGGWGG